ncbi:MAG: branched-chain amino acid ABC transporter permease [Pseudomonadota bacterium]
MARVLFTPHVGGLLVLIAVIVIAPYFFPSNFYFRIFALVWIASIAVVGLNLLMGYAGQVSLGHAGFYGIGAYAVAVLPHHFGVPSLIALVIGLVVAGGLAYLVGRPILRLKGHYLAVATLGMGILIAMVITNEAQFTGGPDGMSVPRLELFGERIRGSDTWYWISGATLVVICWLALNLVNSPTGRALRAVHDSEVAAQVNGIDIAREKLKVFVLSAVFAALAGSYHAFMGPTITPVMADFLHSIELVIMVVIGGMGSVFGSVVGAAFLVTLPQLLTVFDEYKFMMLGLLMMAFMIFLRDGIVPSLGKLLRGRFAPAKAEEPSSPKASEPSEAKPS